METVLPRQKSYPPCVVSSPRGEVALPCQRARQPHSARQSSGASFARSRAPSAVGLFLGGLGVDPRFTRGPAFDTMELRVPVGHPSAAVGGGDAIDGPGFFALNAVQQSALFAFWAAPGEFLVRVTHPAFVQWLVPAGIYFADPTAAGQSCAASHVLESLLLGACRLDPAIAGTAVEKGWF